MQHITSENIEKIILFILMITLLNTTFQKPNDDIFDKIDKEKSVD